MTISMASKTRPLIQMDMLEGAVVRGAAMKDAVGNCCDDGCCKRLLRKELLCKEVLYDLNAKEGWLIQKYGKTCEMPNASFQIDSYVLLPR